MTTPPRRLRRTGGWRVGKDEKGAAGDPKGKLNMQYIDQLESRRLLASFTASSVAELIGDINAANAAGGANTITLKAGTAFQLNAVDNSTDGPNGLPVITAGDNLTIAGNGDTIERSTRKGTPAFRLIDVAFGASLSVNNLTLSRGLAGVPGFAEGGGIYCMGNLSLVGVTVQNCIAQGGAGLSASGGGIRSGGGVLNIDNSTIQNNEAVGGGGYPDLFFSHPGGSAYGGGLDVGSGTVNITNTIIFSNLARGGDGATSSKRGSYSGSPARAGDGFGGGIAASAATVTLRTTTITRNSATGGASPRGAAVTPTSKGGGLWIGSSSVVGIDAVTLANTSSNSASTSDDDISGSFSILA